ncbi:uncharacterized protein A4U43_C06F1990 [Asparagus officinalis]|uniref:Uncharacterized protein n=1 Tax=Asparagus officinalis TaxID=4686 RepID=A0A5P1EJ09_ASPOF|nr:uncharacterized protein A4U43_C06F1990 [Asparagus officinalis]
MDLDLNQLLTETVAEGQGTEWAVGSSRVILDDLKEKPQIEGIRRLLKIHQPLSLFNIGGSVRKKKMTENLRRRTSKWDMLADPHIPIQQAETPIKADNGGVPGLEWNSSKVDANASSLPSELKSDSAKTNNEDYEENKFAGWLHTEDGNVGLANTHSRSPHFPKLPDMDADDGNNTKNSYRKSLSVNYTTEKDQDFNRTGDRWNQLLEQNHRESLSPSHDAKREDDIVRLSNTRSPSPHFPNIPDIYAGGGDYLKHSYKEPSSVNHTTAKDEDLNRTGDRWNKSLEENHHESLSPSRDAKRKRSPISPKRSWGRSYRYFILTLC